MIIIVLYLIASFTCWDLFWISGIDQWEAAARLLFLLFGAFFVHLDIGIIITLIRKYK